MPWKTESPSARNALITAEVLGGETCRTVATRYHLSITRIQEIVRSVCRARNPQVYARLIVTRQYCQLLPALRDYRYYFRGEE